MAVSGTTDFNPDFTIIAEEAFERCGKELRSGYDLQTARRSLNFLTIEWVNRGINFWTLEQGTVALVAGTATYNLPADTVDILEHVIRTNAGVTSSQLDISLNRISMATYSDIPNKLLQGRPLQIMVNRARDNPSVTLWPIPDDTTTWTLVYWRMRRIQDIGTGVNTPDMPFRFYPALVAGLAYYLSMKLPDVEPGRISALKADYEQQFEFASGEDRDRSTQRWTPRRQFIGSS